MKSARMVPPEPYFGRIEKLRTALEKARVDGCLVGDRMDQIWLTGFTGEDGFTVVTPKTIVLLTDGRFDEAADREAPYAKKVLRKKRDPASTAKEIQKLKLGRIGFNADQMSVSAHGAYKKHLAPAKLVALDDPILPLRAHKDPGEVDRIRDALRVAEQGFERVRGWLRPGQTEREIAAQLAYEMQKLGAQGEFFPSIVAAGPNASLPHYEPGERRLAENEVLLIDWGARVNWYGSDLTRVVWLGSPSAEMRKVFDVVREAHDKAIEAVRPGMRSHDLDKVARQVIEKAGYGTRFNHALGHGLGIVCHEVPRIGKGTELKLEPGMVITIEPGVYLPGVGGVRLEDDVLVTETGYEMLSTLPVTFGS